MSIEEKQLINEEELEMVAGGSDKMKVTYVCQACGVRFKDYKDKKWKGEPACKKCRKPAN